MKTPRLTGWKVAGDPNAPLATPAPLRHERTMRRRLGEVLVSRGVITEVQLDELLAEQAAHLPSDGGTRLRLGQLVS
ncbi:MAG: hypothetical protein ACJ73L_00585, partial [Actinomycetes bacterium]